ncbi:hypothetical protein J2S90_002764 [Arthrobacter bambusae]|uniref:Uncharacterized protein n=2 Tax=Arthrobacter TaxID=1663 RepID=A0AAW8DKX1_9MICC|nr:hypothetical protein [Arthrobacter bambusae]MDQ0130380.1 hypothetical protein [Arthrobacter bambusae]MDQ0181699.1 hypothetical protein [Arthrobacter bambusae]
MKMVRNARKVVSVGALTALMAIGVASGAQATSASGTAYFDNGQPITANMWIQPVSNGGCGSFSSSAVMNVSPNWIRNTTSFYQYGVGSISIKGVNVSGSGTSNPATLQWTNSNGARGSYLSGTVCMGWGAFYLGADVAATAYYYGNLRTASARV